MILTEIPRAIARHLASKPFFQVPVQIPVRAFCEKDIVDWVASQMAGLGLSMTVYTTGGKAAGQAKPGCVRLENMKVIVEVKENIVVNRSSGSGVAAESAAEAAAAYLAGYYPLTEAGVQIPEAAIMNVDEVIRAEDENSWCWQAIMKTSCMIKTEGITQYTQRAPQSEFATPTI